MLRSLLWLLAHKPTGGSGRPYTDRRQDPCRSPPVEGEDSDRDGRATRPKEGVAIPIRGTVDSQEELNREVLQLPMPATRDRRVRREASLFQHWRPCSASC